MGFKKGDLVKVCGTVAIVLKGNGRYNAVLVQIISSEEEDCSPGEITHFHKSVLSTLARA